jgi:molybdopterin-guanine dinucleotide biosynthesis protein B
LHRSVVGKPYLYPEDPTIVALACDDPPEETPGIPVLDINSPSTIADFIYTRIYSGS